MTFAIPLAEPCFDGNERRYVNECLETGWVSSGGRFVGLFETTVAQYVGARFAVATVNGTSALHVALKVAGVQAGDEVVVPAFTFIAPVNAVRYCGAEPVFLDVEPATCALDPQRLADFLSRETTSKGGRIVNRRTGRRLAAVVVVHLYGHPADIGTVEEIAGAHGLPVVEDAAESIGARYRGVHLGGRGFLTCFSFNGNKVVTTGGGGMLTTNDETLATRARHLTTQAKSDPGEYVHDDVGFNYRMPNINAALGVAQLEQLDRFVERKRAIAAAYQKSLGSVAGVEVSREAQWALSTYWLVNILLDSTRRPTPQHLRASLAAKGIESRLLWRPISHQAPYAACQVEGTEVADLLYRRGLSLPCAVTMTQDQLETVCEHVRRELG